MSALKWKFFPKKDHSKNVPSPPNSAPSLPLWLRYNYAQDEETKTELLSAI